MPSAFVINADDLGLAPSATAGILQAHEQGVVTSASLVTTTPFFDETIQQISKYPQLGIGLHFTLNAGKPVADSSQVPLLLDDKGFLNGDFSRVLGWVCGSHREAYLQQIGIELKAQLDKAKSVGLNIDHINSERHVHIIPPVYALVAQAALERGIRIVRTIHDVGLDYLNLKILLHGISKMGILKLALLDRMSRTANPKLSTDNYASMMCTGRMDLIMEELWARPPEGVTEIAVHPGRPEIPLTENLGRPDLVDYLGSEDRKKELDICLALKGKPTTARLVRFGDLR